VSAEDFRLLEGRSDELSKILEASFAGIERLLQFINNHSTYSNYGGKKK